MPGDQDFTRTQIANDSEKKAEIERRTRELSILSSQLFDKRGQFGSWQFELDQILRQDQKLKVTSLHPKNYHQVVNFPGVTTFGENPTLAEVRYGDDFHKGDGTPKLVSYTSYRYSGAGKKEIETFSPSGNQGVNLTYREIVSGDGSKVVEKQEGGEWVKTEYDSYGNKIEK